MKNHYRPLRLIFSLIAILLAATLAYKISHPITMITRHEATQSAQLKISSGTATLR